MGAMTLILLMMLGLAAAALETDEGAAAQDGLVLVVEVGNRMYPGWKETQRVGLDQPFFLGDTEYKATIREFLPDFRITDGKIVSISQTLGNPAAHVFVFNDSATVDSSWAFLNHPPHFSPRSFFTFRLQEIIGFDEQGEKSAPVNQAAGEDSRGEDK
jgi:hypothetical protein